MSRIVGVHGVGKQQLGERQLTKDWTPALLDGLTRAHARHPGVDDVTMAFYGDLFLPPGQTLSVGETYFTAADIENKWERELLFAWWAAAARAEPQVVAPDAPDTMPGTPASVQGALLALSQSRYFTKVAERLMVADLKQVTRYLSEPGLRKAARDRVRAAIGPDTTVVIGHSLGSVVAYEALCSIPDHQVRAFVTLGSPLGIPNLVFDRLRPAPHCAMGVWPGPPDLMWTNVSDARDVVALVKDLRPSFGAAVVNQLVPNGSHAHDATHYLGKREVGQAIATGLR